MSNEAYRNKVLLHQIYLRRYIRGQLSDFQSLFNLGILELNELLAEYRQDLTEAQFNTFVFRVKQQRELFWKQFTENLKQEGLKLAELEQKAEQERTNVEQGLLLALIPFSILLLNLTTQRNIVGQSYEELADTLMREDTARITQKLLNGHQTKTTKRNLIKSIVGTKRKKNNDGIVRLGRNNATALLRTYLTHASSQARGLLHAQKYGFVVWSAILDSRTSIICASNHGRGRPLSGGSLPARVLPLKPPNLQVPAHPNCRSVEIYYHSVDQLPEEENTFEEFFEKQDEKTQDEILGKTRAKLYREGKLKFEYFLDNDGNILTLDELHDKYLG